MLLQDSLLPYVLKPATKCVIPSDVLGGTLTEAEALSNPY